ncbi:MAG: hypothetical protein O6952_09665 [Planctomycetota bacterium]|nr:hypothetical protein [Planctomycetota bacterium]
MNAAFVIKVKEGREDDPWRESRGIRIGSPEIESEKGQEIKKVPIFFPAGVMKEWRDGKVRDGLFARLPV